MINLICLFAKMRQDFKEILIMALILITIVALVYVFIKFEQTRAWLGCLIVFIVFCTSLVSGFNLYQYYTASGGTFGNIVSDIFGTSTAENLDSYSFKVNSMVFKSTGKADEYRVSIQNPYYDNKRIDTLNTWKIFINDNMTVNNVVGKNYINADYDYIFYNDNFDEIFSDTLKIKFVFYENFYQLDLVTVKGESATEFWQSYFEKENFVVSLKNVNYISNDEFNTDKNIARFVLNLHTVSQNELKSTYIFENFDKRDSGVTITLMYKSGDEFIDLSTFEITGVPEKDNKTYYITYTKCVAFDKVENVVNYYYRVNDCGTWGLSGVGEIKLLHFDNELGGLYSVSDLK